jgi:CxxC motif-containing protein
LTTTVRIKGGVHPLLPVRTDQPIPKQKLREAMLATADLVVEAPVIMGDVVVENFLGLGVNLIATRDLDRVDQGSTESVGTKNLR